MKRNFTDAMAEALAYAERGLWQSELLVSCKGGVLLAMDQQTGALIRKWQGLPKEADDYLKDVFIRQLPQHDGYVFQLNQARTRIEALFLHYYFYIDLESGSMLSITL